MALELYDGSLRGISGKFNEDEVFKIEMRSWRILKSNFPTKRSMLRTLN